ncbi:pertactin domain protein, partial [Bordetella bronchiseptica SBL-F6116]|uniref:autotransporter outer membrane beta-barrel domain-containing protein n=1 Tax=Bordetella bronchiseptica TaxID=518 RepID=UPI0004A14FC5
LNAVSAGDHGAGSAVSAAPVGKHGSLFGSYEYAKGSRQTMPWTFHVGYRYTW